MDATFLEELLATKAARLQEQGHPLGEALSLAMRDMLASCSGTHSASRLFCLKLILAGAARRLKSATKGHQIETPVNGFRGSSASLCL